MVATVDVSDSTSATNCSSIGGDVVAISKSGKF